MKTISKSLAILMMATIGFTACSDDDNTENKNLKEYALQVRFNLATNDSTAEEQLHKTIETAMSAIGQSEKTPYLYLAARDSADAAPKVQKIGKKLEDVLDKNASQMYGNAHIMAIEQQQLETSDSKNCNWSCWYEANYPESENSNTPHYYFSGWVNPKQFFVYNLMVYNGGRTFFSSYPESEKFNENDPDGYCYKYVDIRDLNQKAGGAYLYLVLSGVSKVTHPVFISQLVTDVVMVNTGSDSHCPESLLIPHWKDGKTHRYYPVTSNDHDYKSSKHELNNGAGGPYLWMFYTTDYRDGWVLANKNSDKWQTRIYDDKKRSDAENGYFMHAYKKNDAGQWEEYGNADMNEGTKGNKIYFSLAFRKVM